MGTKKKSFVERLSKRTREFGDQNKQGPGKKARELINKQLDKKKAASKPARKAGGLLSQKLIQKERKQADVRRRVQQEPTTRGRGKVAKVEIAKARKKK